MARTGVSASLSSDDRYITINEFCAKYSIGRTKADQLMHMPGFPRMRVGKRGVRIAESEAHQFLVEHGECT